MGVNKCEFKALFCKSFHSLYPTSWSQAQDQTDPQRVYAKGLLYIP